MPQFSVFVVTVAVGKAKQVAFCRNFWEQIWSHMFTPEIKVPVCRFLVLLLKNSFPYLVEKVLRQIWASDPRIYGKNLNL